MGIYAFIVATYSSEHSGKWFARSQICVPTLQYSGSSLPSLAAGWAAAMASTEVIERMVVNFMGAMVVCACACEPLKVCVGVWKDASRNEQ